MNSFIGKFGLSRRTFLAGSSAGIALGMVTRGSAAAPRANGDGPHHLVANRLVIVDKRFGPGRQFGRMAAIAGAQVTACEGDITDVWTRTLRPALDRGPLIVASVSSAAALFAFEQLSDRHHMTVAFRSDASDGSVLHKLIDLLRQDAGTLAGLTSAQRSSGAIDVPIAWIMRPTSARQTATPLEIRALGV